MNTLFICSQNKLRSPTAENVFSDYPGINVLSAGTNKDAEVPLTDELVSWADTIFVMEGTHRNKLRIKFKEQIKNQKIICLNIPDEFEYMAPELVEILEHKCTNYLANAKKIPLQC
jgi:predicted protein tyrosine phosphatase